MAEYEKKIITHALLAFVLLSIGVVLGKNSVLNSQPSQQYSEKNDHHVVVYYLHSTFRCETCNAIEQMAHSLVVQAYSDAVGENKLLWRTENFQENEVLAKQFGVVASVVVVADIESGVVRDFKRLDDVWTLMEQPEAFNRYISAAIDGYLARIKEAV